MRSLLQSKLYDFEIDHKFYRAGVITVRLI